MLMPLRAITTPLAALDAAAYAVAVAMMLMMLLLLHDIFAMMLMPPL